MKRERAKDVTEVVVVEVIQDVARKINVYFNFVCIFFISIFDNKYVNTI